MNLALRVAINAFAIWVAVGLVSGLTFEGDIWKLLLIGLVLGVANALIKPILKVLSIPMIIITVGLFLLVINWAMFALVVWLAGPERLDLGLASNGFMATLFGAIIVSLVGWAVSTVVPD